MTEMVEARRETVARILTHGGDVLPPEPKVTRAGPLLRYTFDGPSKPMWQHAHYLAMADEILIALGMNHG